MPVKSKKMRTSINLLFTPRSDVCHLRKANGFTTLSATPPSKTDRYAPFATEWMGRPSDTKCEVEKVEGLVEYKILPSQQTAKDNISCHLDTCHYGAGSELLLQEVNYPQDFDFAEELAGDILKTSVFC
jgi:hypothetical protein